MLSGYPLYSNKSKMVLFDGHSNYQEKWVGQLSGERKEKVRYTEGKEDRNKGHTFEGWQFLFVYFGIRVVGILEKGVGVKLKLWLL